MKNLRFVLIILIAMLSAISMFSFQVSAAAIGVNKATMDFNKVLRGGYAQDNVMVSTDTIIDVPVSVEALGDYASWISFDNATFMMNRDHPYVLTVFVQPSEDTPVGKYEIDMRILVGNLGKISAKYGSNVQAAFLVRLNIEVVGDQIISCTLDGGTIQSIEKGYPLDVRTAVTNNGNVRVRPNVQVDIWNKEQTTLVASQRFPYEADILPTTQAKMFKQLQNTLDLGQYWADISVPLCGNAKATSTFDVLERGAIADQGSFEQLDLPFEASVDQILPVTAHFRNLGSRVVSAKFRGTVAVGDKIVGVIETESLDVPPGELAKIQTFYTPKEEGHHILKGRILYNNKLTPEQEAFVDVYAAGARRFNITSIALTIIIIVIILLLLIIIRRRRQQQKRIIEPPRGGHARQPPHPHSQYPRSQQPSQPPYRPGTGRYR